MRNFNNSFNEFIKKEGPSEISYKITFGLSDDSNVVLGNNFSYIKLNEGEYTITKMLWLNDIINHPIYRAFIDEYKDYILKSSERHMNLLISINNSILKFFYRFDINEKNNFNLDDYITIVDDNVNKLPPTPDSSNINMFDIKKKQYEDDIKSLKIILNDFKQSVEQYVNEIKSQDNKTKDVKENLQKGIDISDDEEKILKPEEDNIIKLYTSSINIKEIYERIKSNDRSILKISPEFKNKLDNIVKELRKIVISIKIKNNYITTGNTINTKIEGEEQDIIDELNQKYNYFINFLKRINDLTFPNRTSTNNDLQNAIKDYATGGDTNNFSNVLNYIINIILRNKNEKVNNINYYDVGVSIINPNDDKLPRYEIYLSLDLVEGRINDTNIEKLKCFYNGTDLGNYVQNYFSRNNSYIAENSKIYIKKDDYEKDALYKGIKDNTILYNLPEAKGELKQVDNKKVAGYKKINKKTKKLNKTKKIKTLKKK